LRGAVQFLNFAVRCDFQILQCGAVRLRIIITAHTSSFEVQWWNSES